jgi:dTDP-4-amino-4,6-dideoxygalactose transaminase
MVIRSVHDAKVPDAGAAARQPIAILVPELPATEELIPFLRRIDNSHWYSNYGPLWLEFRNALASFIGARTNQPDLGVTFTSSGTTAIELALRARALADRRLCLMPSFTFIASAHAVCNVGLEPFLLDVDEHSLTLTPEIVARALPHLPEAPAAVLVISAFGAPLDIRAWENFEETHGIPVVFDAAAALMSLDTVGYQPLCVSLHATKLFSIGEGGAVLSTDTALAEQLTAMTGFGFAGSARVSTVRGGNYRISEYGAAIGLAGLATVEQKITRLNRVARRYHDLLRDSPLELQEGFGQRWVAMTLNVRLPRGSVDDTLGHLDRAGVPWRRWWGPGCHAHPAFATLRSADLPVTHDVAPRIIGVPCHTMLTDEAIARTCEQLLMSNSG